MNPKVLIVDDEPEFAELLEFNLRKQGCDTIRAENGIQGLRLARAEMPDVILLDILLPDLDGLSVCDILQSQPSTRGLPVFMLSALDETTRAAEAVAANSNCISQNPWTWHCLGATFAVQRRHARNLSPLH